MFDQQPPARCHAGGPVRCQCRLSLCPGPAPARGRGPGRRVGRAAGGGGSRRARPLWQRARAVSVTVTVTVPADGAQRMVFFYRSLYDAVKQLLRSARLAGRQHTQFDKVYSAGQKRKYGAINRGDMYEINQGYAGPDVSPLPVFLSSDATVICKKMGAHPIISESTNTCCVAIVS